MGPLWTRSSAADGSSLQSSLLLQGRTLREEHLVNHICWVSLISLGQSVLCTKGYSIWGKCIPVCSWLPEMVRAVSIPYCSIIQPLKQLLRTPSTPSFTQILSRCLQYLLQTPQLTNHSSLMVIGCLSKTSAMCFKWTTLTEENGLTWPLQTKQTTPLMYTLCLEASLLSRTTAIELSRPLRKSLPTDPYLS